MSEPLASPRVRALAVALRDSRAAAGLGLREFARILGVAHSRLSGWEKGAVVPSIEMVATLLAKLNIDGDERERILGLARNASDPNLLTTGLPGAPSKLAAVLECESTASKITEWSPGLIPGLLQTSPYARATLFAGDTPARLVDGQVMIRMGRRDILTRPEPIEFHALIGEAGIREVIGSPKIQAEQLQHLLAMANRANVTIQIVRPRRGYHPGLLGPFVVYDYADSPSIVYIEHYRSSAYLFEEQDVADYQAAAHVVCGEAMSPTDSAELIASVITELET